VTSTAPISATQSISAQGAPAQNIQTIFNRIAPVYDHLNDRLSLGLHRVWKQMAVKWSDPLPASVCLDVCCGSGDLTQMLAQQVGIGGQVYGLDFSAALLAAARQRAEQCLHQLPITWVEGDALQLPFNANQFDAATMGYGLRNVTNILQSLQELHRVLKPGAKAAILDFHRPSSLHLRSLQQWYLDTLVVPMAAGMGLREEYAYISPSLDRFPIGAEQVALAYQAGFSQAVHYPIAAGMMGVLVTTK
jgi:demethylphylloquinol methyltransferase